MVNRNGLRTNSKSEVVGEVKATREMEPFDSRNIRQQSQICLPTVA